MHIARVTLPAAPELTAAKTPRPCAARGRPRRLAGLAGIGSRPPGRTAAALALEERDLRDIGLTPSEAWALTQEPLLHR
ncbi:hypothetical protein [Dankookia sp. P2]|uniref:hypothetical protein n=1 Tax=Dankookia sp. P2 TaxID=3423955 RepID=UPI003D66C46B